MSNDSSLTYIPKAASCRLRVWQTLETKIHHWQLKHTEDELGRNGVINDLEALTYKV